MFLRAIHAHHSPKQPGNGVSLARLVPGESRDAVRLVSSTRFVVIGICPGVFVLRRLEHPPRYGVGDIDLVPTRPGPHLLRIEMWLYHLQQQCRTDRPSCPQENPNIT